MKLQYQTAKDKLIEDTSQASQINIMQQMIENPLIANNKDLSKQAVITYIKTAYDEFTDNQISKAFDTVYTTKKSDKELRRETLAKLTSNKRSRRRMSSSNTGTIEDGILLNIKESVGDPNNPI